MTTRPKKIGGSLARLEVGRSLSRFLCAVLALVGAVPIAVGLLLKTDFVRTAAAAETAGLVERLVGVDASYAVRVELVPLHLVLENVVVRASDGGAPALRARRISVTPRLFSLLSGRLDAGDVEIEESHARIVLRDGELANVRYRLPKSNAPAKPLERAPFASLALTDASLDLDVDGFRVKTGPLDIDVFGEPGLAFEVALRAGETQIVRAHELHGEPSVDEDVVCELDTRLRYEQRALLVRRLSLIGTADGDRAPGTRGRCPASEADPNRVAVRLSEVRVVLDDGEPVLADGHVVLRAPAVIGNRFAKGPFLGWVGAALDVRWDKRAKIPDVRGKVRGGGLAMGVSASYAGRPMYTFPEAFDTELEIVGGEIRARNMHATYGHAAVTLESATVRPNDPGVPLHVTRVDSRGLRFADLMEKNDVTRDTIVEWNLDKVLITDFGGTLDPLKLDGDVLSETTGFQIFDRAYHHPARKHMIGVKAATVRTRFGVRPNAVQFMSSRATFGGSEMFTSVVVGFDNRLQLTVTKGSKLDLSDVSPLVGIPMDGLAEMEVSMNGPAISAPLEGSLGIKEFLFAGFPIGDLTSHVRFVPLAIELTDVKGQKGHSRFASPLARIDFDTPGAVLVDGRVRSDRLEIGDFFSMFHFDEDPRFDGIEGRGVVDATVQYDLGGRGDRCGTGYLRVDGKLGMSSLDLFDEHYDSAEARFDYRWYDQEASYLGMQLDAPSVTLKKGDGTLLGNIRMTEGAEVRAHLVGSAVPLSRITSLGDVGRALDGRASAVAEVSGTLDALVADVQAQISPTRIGRATLPGSDLRVHLEPLPEAKASVGKTKCGRPMPAPYDPSSFEADRADGVFHVTGRVFGEQIKLNDFTVSRQRHKRLRGAVAINKLDIGALAELSPVLALADQRLEGRFSGKISVNGLSLDDPSLASASIELDELKMGRGGLVVELARPAKLAIDRGRIPVEGVSIATTVPTGERAVFDAVGSVQGVGTRPRADLTLTLRPTDLSAFARFVPQAERVEGTLAGSLRITGSAGRVVQRGKFTLTGGALALWGAPVSLTNVNVAVGIEPDEIEILEAKAQVGGGTVEMRGGAPLKGMEPGPARVVITARGVGLPLLDGVRAAGDADLELSWQPPREGAERSLPKLSGDVTIGSFRYVRKVTMTADIESLARRGHRTQFESYDPANDLLDLDVRIRASRPLEIDNDLVEAKLSVAEPGLVLSGTNQRFGMRGELDLLKGGRIRLRRNEFEITQGSVRFDDDERIAPRVDVTAVTDYHRYDDALGGGGGASTAASSASGGSGVTAGGRWRITMHAYGDPETLRIDLTSEPALRQDDIFLLLTLGLTRAELDRAQSATAGGSVALEALGRLTGADQAVTETIPVIDEFKLGTAYSSRTGRTEPTVTIGKRLSQRIRAYVTSGLSESREVRSNLQWRLSPRVSVEGSYDNVNDISSSTLGNLGTDVRFRLEFE